MTYDVLVVGAGITGITIAERLANKGLTVLLIESRNHIGGNCYDEYDKFGILIHPYGPHIFHTDNAEVVEYLSHFTDWRPYEHRVTALINERIVPLPFNLDSLKICFAPDRALHLERLLIATYGMGTKIPILQLLESKNIQLNELSKFIYSNVFEGYTLKQWGLSLADIDPSVSGRIPVRISYDDRYFQDYFQKMPVKGFTHMFQRMLNFPNIKFLANTSFNALDKHVKWRHCIYTGTIDGYFKASLGELPYRTLKFSFEHYTQLRHLPSAVLNYPSKEVPWTRISEYKQITGQNASGTSICTEYPGAHIPGKTVPYYPVISPHSSALLDEYHKLATSEAPYFTFAGRLGSYKYLNMDEAVLQGLNLVKAVVAKI